MNASTRSCLALALVGAVLSSASLARAQGVDEFGPYGGLERPERIQSPQNVAVELRFGPYLPDIDSEFGGGAHPFADHFGNDNRYLIGVELDWQAIRIPYFGSIGPGFGAGYTSMDGKTTTASGATADQETSLTLFPFYVVGVARVDVLARETPVPLVPYAKLGLGLVPWSSSGGSGTSKAGGVEGSDVSYGLQYSLGMMLLLDVFEPSAAVDIDADSGVNNSYFFGEWYVADLNGFGSGNQAQMGTNTWMIGLALEM